MQITQDMAIEFLRYEPETGFLIWIKKASDKTVVGKRAGWSRSPGGYRQVGFMGEIIYEHRLIWLILTGAFPLGQVDHKNGIKGDNRFVNLREAQSSQNLANIGPKRDNTSGQKNVHWCDRKKRWIAKIKRDGKTTHVGTFSNFDAAVEAARQARIDVFGAFSSDLGHDAAAVAWPYRRAAA